MTVLTSNLLKLARQGDSNAITEIMNYLLKSKGITVAANLKHGCLYLILQADKTPDQECAITYTYKILNYLNIDGLTQVKVYGRRKGATFLSWNQDLSLKKPSLEKPFFWNSLTWQRTNLGGASDDEVLNNTKGYLTEISASGMEIANALKNLPQTAEELIKEMPKIADRLRYGAGQRNGTRPSADVMRLFDKIPGTSKLGSSETKILEFLKERHGSHIVPHQQGGSSNASNIIWEIGIENSCRGNRVITSGEQVRIHFYNAVDSILQNSVTLARLGINVTLTAVLTQVLITAASYALDLYRGDITIEEFRDRIVEAAISAGITTPIFFLIFVTALALIPGLAALLSSPPVVAGFSILFGISIVVPIIQSIIRHIQAEGFGEEAAEIYNNLLGETQAFLKTWTDQIADFGENFGIIHP